MKTQLSTFVNLPIWRGEPQALQSHIFSLIEQKKSCSVVTVNAEMLLCASSYMAVAAAIRSSSICVADSVSSAAFFRAKRIPGVDLAEELLVEAGKRDMPVVLIGGMNEKARSGATEFATSRGCSVAAQFAGPIVSYEDELPVAALTEIAESINTRNESGVPLLIMVGFGHGKQERAIDFLRQHVHAPSIFIGVGGAFDMWSGITPRAPHGMRVCGLEWLWRLWLEPRRIMRIVRATIIFPLRAFFNL